MKSVTIPTEEYEEIQELKSYNEKLIDAVYKLREWYDLIRHSDNFGFVFIYTKWNLSKETKEYLDKLDDRILSKTEEIEKTEKRENINIEKRKNIKIEEMRRERDEANDFASRVSKQNDSLQEWLDQRAKSSIIFMLLFIITAVLLFVALAKIFYI